MSAREEAREMLRELLAEALGGNGNGGHRQGQPGGDATGSGRVSGGGAPPTVPARPVAAVLRPSTWSQPPAPGEVIGEGGAGEPAAGAPRAAGGGAAAAGGGGAAATGGGARVEAVALRTDADLSRFVDAVLANAAAIRSGALRFTLGGGGGAAGVRRIERGAVTERTVNEAASAGQRLVLAPAAVLTPLARERARHLKVEIERERRC
jgi:hypothetical protein